jgi:DNA-binding Xre family transcriptional regulator
MERLYTTSITHVGEKNMIVLKVKEVAEAKKISQGKLSRKADVDVKTIRRIFRNPTEIITTETLDKIATALEVDVCELLEQVPNLSKN